MVMPGTVEVTEEQLQAWADAMRAATSRGFSIGIGAHGMGFPAGIFDLSTTAEEIETIIQGEFHPL